MPIPEQFNGDLSLWWNQIVGDLSAGNMEMEIFQKYWGSFTHDQKVAIIGIFRGLIATTQTSLTELDTYLQTIPT